MPFSEGAARTLDQVKSKEFQKIDLTGAEPLVNLMTRQTRDSSNQESVLVHLGLQIGLNFVPASKTETRLRPAVAGRGRP